MLNIQNILFPTNLSEASANTLQYALQVAEATHAKLHLLYVLPKDFDVPVPSITYFKMQQELKARGKKQLHEFVQKNIPQDFHQHITEHIGEGFVGESIIQSCKEQGNIDLVILGTKGNYSLSKAIWSDRVAYIIEKSTSPVLVVPEDGQFRFVKTIAYAGNLDENSTSAVYKVLDLANQSEAKVLIINLKGISKVKRFERELDTQKYPNVEIRELADANDIKQIQQFIVQNEVDLLVMHEPYRNLLSRILRYSKTQKLAIITKVPMLVFKELG